MRKFSLYFLILTVFFSSCSYRQFGAVATGSSLGGMFGSSIGGLMGGALGADKGTLAGMLIGGAVGVAVTTPRNQQNDADDTEYYNQRDYDDVDLYNRQGDDVEYGSYNSPRFRSPMAGASDLGGLQIQKVAFLDENDNQCLDRDERACIILDIKNTGSHMLYNITPQITCNSNRVVISPAATISSLSSGRGVRYKAMVHAYRRINKKEIRFQVSFGNGPQAVTAKTFTIRTR